MAAGAGAGAGAPMTARERVRAVLAGQTPDRPPVSLWRHFPEEDQTADGLAAATLRWQERFGFDLVKLMPPGDYPTIDWGAESRYQGSTAGTRTTIRFPIERPADWAKLRHLDPGAGFNGVMLAAVRQTRAGLDPAVPLLQTIFSPLTVAMKLSRGRAIEHLRAHPQELRAALEVIAETTAGVAAAALDAGADGIFFASQCTDYTLMDEVEYREFGVPFDRRVLAPLVDRGERAILLLHLHGERPMLQLATRYPPGFVNWHDRRTHVPLHAGAELTNRPVAGGIDERAIATGEPEPVAEQVRDATAQMAGRLLVAPGCVIPITTPDANVAAAVAAATGTPN